MRRDLTGIDRRTPIGHQDVPLDVVGNVVRGIALAAENRILFLVGPTDAVFAEGQPKLLAASNQLRMWVAAGRTSVVDHQVASTPPPFLRGWADAETVVGESRAAQENIIGLAPVRFHESQAGGSPLQAVRGFEVSPPTQPVESGWSRLLDENVTGRPKSVQAAVVVADNANIGVRSSPG